MMAHYDDIVEVPSESFVDHVRNQLQLVDTRWVIIARGVLHLENIFYASLVLGQDPFVIMNSPPGAEAIMASTELAREMFEDLPIVEAYWVDYLRKRHHFKSMHIAALDTITALDGGRYYTWIEDEKKSRA